jgi:hypothetical protein
MGVLYDYFAAGSDEAAAATIDRDAGPSKAGDDGPAFDTVPTKGIDPYVQMGTLEEILTGVPYATVIEDPRLGNVLADRDGGNRLVMTLTEALQSALASVDTAAVTRAADAWAKTDEFRMDGVTDGGQLAPVLNELAALARRARGTNDRLYCWLSV